MPVLSTCRLHAAQVKRKVNPKDEPAVDADEPTTWKQALNLLLIVAAPLPSMWLVGQLGSCDKWQFEFGRQLCTWTSDNPIVGINILFFLNVDVGFWLLSLVQDSTWLIDPYWCIHAAVSGLGRRYPSPLYAVCRRTLIPPLIAHFYRAHPKMGRHDPSRSLLTLVLVWAWALRLTHNYFRRERCGIGRPRDAA